jgi:hypothetical protein
MFNEDNQIHNFISSSGSGTVIKYGSGSDFLTSYGSGSGSTTLIKIIKISQFFWWFNFITDKKISVFTLLIDDSFYFNDRFRYDLPSK